MRIFWKRDHEKIITFGLFSILFVAVMSMIAIIGGAIMRFFGFRYQSAGSIILFFCISGFLTYPIGVVVEALPKILLSFGRLLEDLRPVSRCGKMEIKWQERVE